MNVGIADLPNQRHKIILKKGTTFTLMAVGESGLGKTTFINTLFTTLIKSFADPAKRHLKQLDRTVDISITKAELEENGFSLKLNVIDTPGFGDYVNNSDAHLPLVEFIDQQHDSYMRQEAQPDRSSRNDLRVHACLYFIRPTGHTLKPLDIQVMKHLGQRVNLIPVIGKADTMSLDDLKKFKKKVRSALMDNNIRIYQIDTVADAETDEVMKLKDETIMGSMPYAVIGSMEDVFTKDARVVKGREYPWGVVEVENPAHCDFAILRDLLIHTHMLDLVSSTEEVHYDNYRQRVQSGEVGPKGSQLTTKFKTEEDELRRRFTEQVKQEEQRFRQWEAKLIGERDRLNKDLEADHSSVKQLEIEVESLNRAFRR
jgi:cell division control protein 12